MSGYVRTVALCAFVASSLPLSPAMAATWDGETNTNFFVGTNWSPNGVPGVADTVTINGAGAFNQPLLGAANSGTFAQVNVSAGSLTIDGSLTAPVAISGTGTVAIRAGGSLVGPVNVNTGGTLTIAGTLIGSVNITYGLVRSLGGEIVGNVENNGSLELNGDTIDGNLNLASTAGTLLLDASQLASVTGIANVTGTVALDLSSIAFNQPVLTLDLLRARQIANSFADLSLTGLDTDYIAAAGVFKDGDFDVYRLTLTEVPEPASLALLAAGLALLALMRRGSSRRISA